jgi:hypothetical protein
MRRLLRGFDAAGRALSFRFARAVNTFSRPFIKMAVYENQFDDLKRFYMFIFQ